MSPSSKVDVRRVRKHSHRCLPFTLYENGIATAALEDARSLGALLPGSRADGSSRTGGYAAGGMTELAGKILFYGDNLDVLRRHVADESIDLVYLDPPFNSNASYNVLFGHADGSRAAAQIKAFDDTWHWDHTAAATFQDVVASGGQVAKALIAFQTLLGPSTMLAYLSMMAPRLVELRRVLKSSGSIYLHCDPTASHYLKLLMDAVFGTDRFLNEIVWSYKTGGASKRHWARKHDTILLYTKTKDWAFNPQKERSYMMHKYGFKKSDFKIDPESGLQYSMVYARDVWEVPSVGSETSERLGYPTQKPEALLTRIIEASCPPDGVVLDPFCGCGTTIAAAEKLERRWIGIDLTFLAISLIKSRLTALGSSDYTVLGEPTTSDDAADLAGQDPHQFQLWALGLIGARPGEVKKGADHGIDGRLFFFDGDQSPKQVIVSVKAGKVQVSHVRDLRGFSTASRPRLASSSLSTSPRSQCEPRPQAQGSTRARGVSIRGFSSSQSRNC
jgi:site-specific DNA-methyltransferase (adenine-specific)